MKTLLALTALTIVAAGSYVGGMKTEYITHAYEVHVLTQRPLLIVLDPIHRKWSVSPSEDEEEEVCGPHISCEANQD